MTASDKSATAAATRKRRPRLWPRHNPFFRGSRGLSRGDLELEGGLSGSTVSHRACTGPCRPERRPELERRRPASANRSLERRRPSAANPRLWRLLARDLGRLVAHLLRELRALLGRQHGRDSLE